MSDVAGHSLKPGEPLAGVSQPSLFGLDLFLRGGGAAFGCLLFMFFGGGALFWQLFLFGEPSGSPLLAVYGLLCLFLFGRSPVLAV